MFGVRQGWHRALSYCAGYGHARGDVISTHRTIEAADRKLSRMNRYSSFYALTDLEEQVEREAERAAMLAQTA